jgi:hypothetical protein
MSETKAIEVYSAYRVVEHNSAYDHIFGIGEGWICASNHVTWSEAWNIIFTKWLLEGSQLKYTIKRFGIGWRSPANANSL